MGGSFAQEVAWEVVPPPHSSIWEGSQDVVPRLSRKCTFQLECMASREFGAVVGSSCSPASNFCCSSLRCCYFNAMSLSLSAISLSLCSHRFANSPLTPTCLLAGGSPVTPDTARKHRSVFFKISVTVVTQI